MQEEVRGNCRNRWICTDGSFENLCIPFVLNLWQFVAVEVAAPTRDLRGHREWSRPGCVTSRLAHSDGVWSGDDLEQDQSAATASTVSISAAIASENRILSGTSKFRISSRTSVWVKK